MASISDTIITNLRLAGERAYAAGMNTAAAAGERLAAANLKVDETAVRMGGQLNQSAFNMGNLLHVVNRLALGMGLLAGAGAYVGLKFEASMEQSQVAFGELLNSTDKANVMLQQLFDLAAKTPFEFPQLVDASQKLLGFGMNAREVIPLMTKVGDAVAAVGADPERIDRITRALGQMQAKGKVYSEELLQLADAGLPAYQMLAQGLGVTGSKLAKMLRKGQIDARTGLNILAAQMDKRYKGMAAKQAKTFNGLLSTIRDYSRMILGFAVKPLFDYLEKKVLPAITKVETSIVNWGRSGGFKRFQRNLSVAFEQGKTGTKKGLFTPDKQLGLAQKVGNKLGKIWAAVSGYFHDLMEALAPAKPFWDNVLGPFLKGLAVGAFGGFIAILKLAIPIIRIFATVLGWLGTKLAFMRDVFYWVGFAIGFIFGPGKIFGVVTKALGIFGRIIGFLLKPFTWLLKLFGRFGPAIGRMVGDILVKFAPAGSRMETLILKVWEAWDKVIKGFQKGGLAGAIRAAIPQIAAALYMLGGAMAGALWKGIKSKGGTIARILMGPAGLASLGAEAVVGAVGGGPKPKGPTGPLIPSGGSAYGASVPPPTDTRGTAFKTPAIAGIPRIDNYVILDGKIVSKSVAKETDKKISRR